LPHISLILSDSVYIMVTTMTNFSYIILTQLENFAVENLIFISLGITIISIGSFVLYSSNAAKEGLKKVGKILTGIGVGGSVYTGGKEVYKDLKELTDKPEDSSQADSTQSAKDSTQSAKDSGSSTNNSGSNSKS
jgi:hypothetical protein